MGFGMRTNEYTKRDVQKQKTHMIYNTFVDLEYLIYS